MSISVDKGLLKSSLIYAVFTILTALFGGVYELFSHEVYSYFMMYAFATPLVLGLLPTLIAAFVVKKAFSAWGLRFYNAGVAALTVGSLFEGVLRIYGTTNRLAAVYPIAGIILILVGILTIAFSRLGKKQITLKKPR